MTQGEPAPVERASAGDIPGLRRATQDAGEAPHWPETAWLALGEAPPSEVVCHEAPAAEQQRRGAWVLRGPDASLGAWLAASILGEVAELEFVFTPPDRRRRGWARRLLLSWCNELATEGVKEVHLEVRAGNRGAVEMYGSLGFGEVGRRRFYYRDPVDDAILMRRFLP